MHVLFVHQNFPAQFGHIARHLVKHHGFRCTFVSRLPRAHVGGVRRIQYEVKTGNRLRRPDYSRTFVDSVGHAHGVYRALKAHPEVQPDLIVGHSGFGSTLFLADLFACPIINYFEFFHRGRDSCLDFRPDSPPGESVLLEARARNAMILSDLQTCTAGYSPTAWQRSLFPQEYQPKIRTIFDGVDREFWYRRKVPRRVGRRTIPAGMRIVTYVSRGFEPMRGFDVFMQVAKRLYEQRPDVIFVVVGADHVYYGNDRRRVKNRSYGHHVLAQDSYDLSRFIFTGPVPSSRLVEILSLSDLHLYLTVPFVLSWSLMNALAVGCTVLASDTAPVREVIQPGRNGLLAGFFDVEGFVRHALWVLKDPKEYRSLGEAGTRLIDKSYSLARTMPQMLELYRQTVAGARGSGRKSSGIRRAEKAPSAIP